MKPGTLKPFLISLRIRGDFWLKIILFGLNIELREVKCLIMVTILEVEQMSRTEKLQAMEAIWTALSKVDADVESPSWHADMLRETEERVARCEERIVDWDIAKRELRKRFE